MSTNTMHMSPAYQTLEKDPIVEVHLFYFRIYLFPFTQIQNGHFIPSSCCHRVHTMYWKTSLKKLLLELLQRNDFHLSSLDRGT